MTIASKGGYRAAVHESGRRVESNVKRRSSSQRGGASRARHDSMNSSEIPKVTATTGDGPDVELARLQLVRQCNSLA